MSFKLLVDGKWNGGSYRTASEAETEAKKYPGRKTEVVPKGVSLKTALAKPDPRK